MFGTEDRMGFCSLLVNFCPPDSLTRCPLIFESWLRPLLTQTATRLKQKRSGSLEGVALEYEKSRAVADQAEHDEKADE